MKSSFSLQDKLLALLFSLVAGLNLYLFIYNTDAEFKKLPGSECRPDKTECVIHLPEIDLHVQLIGDIKPLSPFKVVVRSPELLAKTDLIKNITSIKVSFDMKNMQMGDNSYELQHMTGSEWYSDVRLPVCTTGRSDWFMTLNILYKDIEYSQKMEFQSF